MDYLFAIYHQFWKQYDKHYDVWWLEGVYSSNADADSHHVISQQISLILDGIESLLPASSF